MEFLKQGTTGLYHLCPKKKISKFDLLKLFCRVWNKEIEIIPFENYKVDKSLVCTRNDFKYPTLEFDSMLKETKFWMDEHPTYYKHYEL